MYVFHCLVPSQWLPGLFRWSAILQDLWWLHMGSVCAGHHRQWPRCHVSHADRFFIITFLTGMKDDCDFVIVCVLWLCDCVRWAGHSKNFKPAFPSECFIAFSQTLIWLKFKVEAVCGKGKDKTENKFSGSYFLCDHKIHTQDRMHNTFWCWHICSKHQEKLWVCFHRHWYWGCSWWFVDILLKMTVRGLHT